MAYDIYGNNLRRDFCEVHPDVAQPYPCYYCLEESRAYQAQEEYEHRMQQEHDQALEAEYFASLCAPWLTLTNQPKS